MGIGLGLVLGVLLLLGLGVAAWVLVPGLRGSEAARRALGTHRLAIGSIVTVVVLNALLTLPLAPVLHVERGLTSGSFAVATATTQIPMLLVVYVRLIVPGVLTWRELGLRPLPVDYALRMGLGAGVVGLILTQIVGALLNAVGLRPNQLEQFAFVRAEGVLAFAILLLSAGLLAPLVEEIFFRGFIFGTYRARYSAPVAYLASGVLFTALHLEPNRMNLAQMAGLSVGILLLATMLAWLYEHTGSLYPGILAHAVNNATGLILFYVVDIR